MILKYYGSVRMILLLKKFGKLDALRILILGISLFSYDLISGEEKIRNIILKDPSKDNLIINGGFDKGLEGWQLRTTKDKIIRIVDDPQKTGNTCCQIDNNSRQSQYAAIAWENNAICGKNKEIQFHIRFEQIYPDMIIFSSWQRALNSNYITLRVFDNGNKIYCSFQDSYILSEYHLEKNSWYDFKILVDQISMPKKLTLFINEQLIGTAKTNVRESAHKWFWGCMNLNRKMHCLYDDISIRSDDIPAKDSDPAIELEEKEIKRQIQKIREDNPAGEIRTMWFESKFPQSRDEWIQTMMACKEEGINTIVIQTGGWQFTSMAQQCPEKDKALQHYRETIRLDFATKAAHQFGIKVFASFCPFRGNLFREKFPEALVKTKDGSIFEYHSSCYFCPSSTEIRRMVKEMYLNVIDKYDIDGIDFDYMRFPWFALKNRACPGSDFEVCYCKNCEEQFYSQHKIKLQDIPTPGIQMPEKSKPGDKLYQQWTEFRCGRITSLVEEIVREARLKKPSILISACVDPQYEIRKREAFQDWVVWIDKGLIDIVNLMVYTRDANKFKSLIETAQKATESKVKFVPVIGQYMGFPLSTILEEINITRGLKTGGYGIFVWWTVTTKEHHIFKEAFKEETQNGKN